MSGRTADFFSCRPPATTPLFPSHIKRASYSSPTPPPPRLQAHDRRASWHSTGTSLSLVCAASSSSSSSSWSVEDSKVSDLEARLSAAAGSLGGRGAGCSLDDAPTEPSSAWEADSESSVRAEEPEEEEDAAASSDDFSWSSPDDSPLPTPIHSPSLAAARPLKPALRSPTGLYSSASSSSIHSSDSAAAAELPTKRRCSSIVSFQDEPEVCPTWSQFDYERAGPPPVFKLSIREVLELRQLKLECALRQQELEQEHHAAAAAAVAQQSEQGVAHTTPMQPLFSKDVPPNQRPAWLCLNEPAPAAAAAAC